MTLTPPVSFSEEDQEFISWVKEFGSKYSDKYLQYANSEEFPWDLAEAMGEQGLLGFGVSSECGGSGILGDEVTYTQLGIIHQYLAYSNFQLAQIAYSCNIMGPLLEANLNSSDKAEWVSDVVSGRQVIAMGVTEPGAGTDMKRLRTKATKTDGGWLVSGEKTSITFAPHAKAVITLAKTTGDDGKEGFTAFLVPLDSDGVSMQIFKDLAWRPNGRAGIFYDDVYVPDEYVLGPVGGAFRVVLKTFDYARVMTGLMALGMGQRALDTAVEYAKTRETFGQPISKYQGVSFPLVERNIELEAASWMSYRALSLADLGQPYVQAAASAKYYGVERALDAAREAVVVLGHNGVSEEFPLQSLLRDISGLQLGEGAPQIQKLVIARNLFGREYIS